MKLRLVLSSLLAVSSVIVACSGDDPEASPSTAADGGAQGADATVADGNSPTPQPQDSGTPTGEEDGGLVVDGGGGNPDEEGDAGIVGDAGPDGGGACGPASGNGAAVASTCSQFFLLAQGGMITPGSYDLVGYTVLGNATYCGSFTPGNYSGRLDVAPDGSGGFVFGERVVKAGGLSLFPNKSFAVTVDNKSLKVSQSCGPKVNATSWGFTVTKTGDKPTIIYSHDSGSATVYYRWVLR